MDKRINEIIAMPHWKNIVLESLNSNDNIVFHNILAGGRMNIDVWDYYYQRAKKGISEDWYFLMMTENPKRIDLVLDIALQRLNLNEGTGPETNLFGSINQINIQFIVQGLKNVPGTGWQFIKAGLNSSVIASRNFTCNTLLAWKEISFPYEIIQILKRNKQIEPDETVLSMIEEILK